MFQARSNYVSNDASAYDQYYTRWELVYLGGGLLYWSRWVGGGSDGLSCIMVCTRKGRLQYLMISQLDVMGSLRTQQFHRWRFIMNTIILSDNQQSLYYSISIEYKMENTKPAASSLEQKLQLLKALRSGRLQESQKLLANLSATSRTNPALYSKFHTFLAEHRKDIEEIQNEEKEQEPRVVLVQGSDNESWVTDDSVDLSVEEEAEQPPPQHKNEGMKHQEENERRLMRNVSNTKSTSLLNQTKQAKRPFLIQTKMKDAKGHASALLKRGSSVTKLDFQNKSLLTTLSKSNLLAKNLPKQVSKPYFPPINIAKSTLKLK